MPRHMIVTGLCCALAVALIMNLSDSAYSQTSSAYVPIGASTGVGALSTAWFIDAGAQRVIMCTGSEGRSPQCSAAAIP